MRFIELWLYVFELLVVVFSFYVHTIAKRHRIWT